MSKYKAKSAIRWTFFGVFHFFLVSFFFLFLYPFLLHSLFQSVCLDFPAVLLLVSVLFVDVGDEEEAGPLRRFQNSRERCKFLAPSISVSVPEDDPYHSDEEYYEHPLFSPEWTHSGSRPTGQAVAFRQIEGEPRMVPLCHFPLHLLSLLPLLSLFNTNFFCDLTSLHPYPFRSSVSPSVSSSLRPSLCVFVCPCGVCLFII